MNSLNPSKTLLSTILIAATVGVVSAEPSLTIDADQVVAKSSPILYGLMTEEINYCYDGGLYAELVRNRAFKDDPEKPVHWLVLGEGSAIALDKKVHLNDKLDTSLRWDITSATRRKPARLANEGYWGIPVKSKTTYRASFYAKAGAGFKGKFSVAIVSTDGNKVYARKKVKVSGNEWRKYELKLKTGKVKQETADAQLVISTGTEGTVWLDLVSLFPPTWNDRPNGLRKDLMQMLVDLKPKFLRFPGGNYLEGDYIDLRFKWWETLGPLTERPGHPCPWGYRSSDGMGLMEFLLWCEDMGAEPVLGLYAGYSLKGDHVQPGPDLDPYVQEALEEIEYVIGPTNSTWGARRAQDGHPEPFNLHYVEIGNEDWFDGSGSYEGRFAQFYDAIKAKYPHLKCISSIGSEQPENKRVHSREPDVLDEHFYRSTDEFLKMSKDYYEKYDRNGPKIFVGEWAAHEDARIRPWSKEARKQPPTPNMTCAIGDAAFMTDMERNSDLVIMQAYAPLFVNVNEYQWRPDLIGYNALTAFGSPSYYAIRMFSCNFGDEILKCHLESPSLLHSVTRDSQTGAILIKLVNPEPVSQSLKLEIKGVPSLKSKASVITLAAGPNETNSMNNPTNVVPLTSSLSNVKPVFDYTLPATSIVVLRLEPQ